jgi:hypothetical protein
MLQRNCAYRSPDGGYLLKDDPPFGQFAQSAFGVSGLWPGGVQRVVVALRRSSNALEADPSIEFITGQRYFSIVAWNRAAAA